MTVPSTKTLKQRILHAGSWSIVGHGLTQLIRLGSNLIMTRLLVPEMFGVMSIAITLTIILGLLSDLGVQQNIMQSSRGNDPEFLDTAWVVQITRGLGLWLIAVAISIALYFGNIAGWLPEKSVYAVPILPLVIAITGFSAVIAGFQSTKIATAHRGFNQKRLMQIGLISQLIGLLFMVAMASYKPTIWALVGGTLIAAAVTTVLSHLWIPGHTNRFRIEKSALHEQMAFGKWVFLSSGLYVLATHGDKLLLGAYIETDTLGLYVIAAIMINAIAGVIHKLFFTVSLPALCEIARTNRSRLHEVYNRLSTPGDLLMLLLTGLLFAAGHLIIDALYDPRYQNAGIMLELLALSLFAVRYEGARQLYLAMGFPQYGTVLSAARFISLCVLVPAMYHFNGAQGAILGVALHSLVTVPFVLSFNTKLGVTNVRRELLVLAALPIGYWCGILANHFFGK